MTKLIGTGKDPRFPAGQDYDVNEADVPRHVEAGLGEPVEPGAEAYASHRGYDTIAEDPGEVITAGGPQVQNLYGFESRSAARIETTSAEAHLAREGAEGAGGAGAASARALGADPAEAPRSEGGPDASPGDVEPNPDLANPPEGTVAGPDEVTDPAAGEDATGAEDRSEPLAGDALQERAAELGIEDRSSMSDEELREAVAERESQGGAEE